MTKTGKVTEGQLPKHTVSLKILQQILDQREFDDLMFRYVTYRDQKLFSKQK